METGRVAATLDTQACKKKKRDLSKWQQMLLKVASDIPRLTELSTRASDKIREIYYIINAHHLSDARATVMESACHPFHLISVTTFFRKKKHMMNGMMLTVLMIRTYICIILINLAFLLVVIIRPVYCLFERFLYIDSSQWRGAGVGSRCLT